MANDAQDPSSAGGGPFMTTHWSLVLAAAGTEDSRGRRPRHALPSLLVSALRLRPPTGSRSARRPGSDAGVLHAALGEGLSRRRGSFEGQVPLVSPGDLEALFVQGAGPRQNPEARRRATLVPLDSLLAEDRYRREPEDNATPERLFDSPLGLDPAGSGVDAVERGV